jgi:hypothetical protein
MAYDNYRSFGSWKSVKEQDRDREQDARDRRGEANTAYLADEAND